MVVRDELEDPVTVTTQGLRLHRSGPVGERASRIADLLDVAHQAPMDDDHDLVPGRSGRTRSRVGPDGRLEWAHAGSLPIHRPRPAGHATGVRELTNMLNYVADRFDSTAKAVR